MCFSEKLSKSSGLDILSKTGMAAGGTTLAIEGVAKAFESVSEAASHVAEKVREQFSEVASLSKQAFRLDMKFDDLEALKMSFEKIGLDAEGIDRPILKMKQTISEAAHGAGTAVFALRQLGLAAKDLQRMDTTSAFLAITKGIQGQAGGDRIGLFNDIFGRGGKEMATTDWGKSFEQSTEKAKRLGLEIGSDEQAMRAADTAIKDMDKAFTGLWRTLAVQLAPATTAVFTTMTTGLLAIRPLIQGVSSALGGMGDILNSLATNPGVLALADLSTGGIGGTVLGNANAGIQFARMTAAAEQRDNANKGGVGGGEISNTNNQLQELVLNYEKEIKAAWMSGEAHKIHLVALNNENHALEKHANQLANIARWYALSKSMWDSDPVVRATKAINDYDHALYLVKQRGGDVVIWERMHDEAVRKEWDSVLGVTNAWADYAAAVDKAQRALKAGAGEDQVAKAAEKNREGLLSALGIGSTVEMQMKKWREFQDNIDKLSHPQDKLSREDPFHFEGLNPDEAMAATGKKIQQMFDILPPMKFRLAEMRLELQKIANLNLDKSDQLQATFQAVQRATGMDLESKGEKEAHKLNELMKARGDLDKLNPKMFGRGMAEIAKELGIGGEVKLLVLM